MKLIYPLYIFLALFLDRARACQLSESTKMLIRSTEQIVKKTSSWKGFDNNSLGFVFTDQKNVFLYGFSHQEVQQVFQNATPCEGNPHWYAILMDHPKPLNGFYEPKFPKKNGDPLERLAFVHGNTILLTLTNPDFSGTNFKSDDIARVALHEQFHHAYQFEKKFIIEDSKTFARDYLNRCEKNTQWIADVKRELGIWIKILKDWRTLTNDHLKEKVLNIISDRHSNTSEDHVYCWSATRFWERLEGTAYYVEGEAALSAGLIAETDFNLDTIKYFLPTSRVVTTGPISPVGQLNPSFFYALGGSYVRVLKRIQPDSNFESEIENGASPEEAFSKLIKL